MTLSRPCNHEFIRSIWWANLNVFPRTYDESPHPLKMKITMSLGLQKLVRSLTSFDIFSLLLKQNRVLETCQKIYGRHLCREMIPCPWLQSKSVQAGERRRMLTLSWDLAEFRQGFWLSSTASSKVMAIWSGTYLVESVLFWGCMALLGRHGQHFPHVSSFVSSCAFASGISMPYVYTTSLQRASFTYNMTPNVLISLWSLPSMLCWREDKMQCQIHSKISWTSARVYFKVCIQLV